MWSIYRKELKVYFTSLVGYIVMFLYLGLSVFFFFGFFMYNPESTSDFTGFFSTMDSLYLFIIPILTLRILAEDKKIGTIELLLTSPISTWSIIMGKFLGVLTFVLTGASLMLLYPIFLSFFVSVDWGTVVSGYLGMIFSLSFFVAIGLFASSLTDNYVIAGVVAFGVFFLLFIASSFKDVPVPILSKILTEISFANHYEQFARGIVQIKNMLYFAIGTVIFLYLAKDRIESYSWK